VKQADENWTAYIKQVYGHDRNLASHYDLVLDTGRLGYEATVQAILAALRTRKPKNPLSLLRNGSKTRV
jgi:cytidylate kinase